MKTALVTGASSGIGKAVAFELARRDIHIIVTVRDEKKGEEIVKEITSRTNNKQVEFLICDLSSLKSIRSAVKKFSDRYHHLNILINCAAIFAGKRNETEDGMELMFETNHLGPFLLTNMLIEKLKKGEPARIITVTAPSTVKPDFEDLQGKKKYSSAMTFGATKAENLLFTYALARKLKGAKITANAYHPGVTKGTRLMNHAPFFLRWMMFLTSPFLQTPEQAAAGLADLALSAKFEKTTGKLIHKGKEIKAPMIEDLDSQRRLWEISEKLTGIKD